MAKEENASVVGEVKVSNKLFSLDKFKKTAPAGQTNKGAALHTQAQYQGAIAKRYDLIIIGAGPGGYLAGEEASINGLKTLVIEKEYWGGVCVNVGCIPTKALLKSAEVKDYVMKAHEWGIKIDTTNLKVDWKHLHKRKAEVVQKMSQGIELLLRGNKADMIFGEARLLAPKMVQVNELVYEAKNVIIATGSKARLLPLPGFQASYEQGIVITSREAINLVKLPQKMIIIGGGVIGVEMAQIYASAGTKVTILQNLDSILANLDQDVIKLMTEVVKNSAIELKTNVKIEKIVGNEVYFEHEGKKMTLRAEKVLLSVGRAPYSLGLEAAGIKLGPHKNIEIDAHCQTNIANVYAIGDVVGQSMLAHTAYKHAIVAVNHIIQKQVSPAQLNKIPGCIYTHPEVAVLGLTEQEAKAQKLDYFVARHKMAIIGKAVAANQTDGFAKFIIDKKIGTILGFHLVGQNATDMVSEITLAMENELGIQEIANAVHPHPTFSEVIWEAARKANHKLAKYNRSSKF